MRVVSCFAAVAAMCLLGGLARAEDKADYAKLIVGKWEVSKSDPGTVPAGSVVEFTKDGKMKVTAKKDDKDFNIEGTYKVEKNTFTMSLKIGDDEKMQTIIIVKISAKEMSTKDKDGKMVELKKRK
jgi:uncharacterized protein (TIGR03066 family)